MKKENKNLQLTKLIVKLPHIYIDLKDIYNFKIGSIIDFKLPLGELFNVEINNNKIYQCELKALENKLHAKIINKKNIVHNFNKSNNIPIKDVIDEINIVDNNILINLLKNETNFVKEFIVSNITNIEKKEFISNALNINIINDTLIINKDLYECIIKAFKEELNKFNIN